MKRWLLLLFVFSAPASWSQSAQQLLDSAKSLRFTNLPRALQCANGAYQAAVKAHDSSLMAEATLLKGISLYVMGDYEAALSQYLNALDIYEHIDDRGGMVNVYAELIIFYRHENKPTQTRRAITRGLSIAADIGDTNGLANISNNAGLFYMSVGEYDSATYSFRRGLSFYQQRQDKVGMSYSMDYLATALIKTGAQDEALFFLEKSRDLRLETGDKLGVSESIYNIGELLLSQNKTTQALALFRAARDTAMQINYKELAAHTWQMEARALEKSGHFQEAYTALKRYQELREGLMNEKRVAAVEALQTRYETEKKERQNLELQQMNREQELQISRRNLALLSIVVFVLLTAGITYAFYNRYRLRTRAKLQEERLQQERLRAEAIVTTEEHERQRLARELHDGVGQILAAARRSLQQTTPAVVPADGVAQGPDPVALLDESIAEVRTLSHSMMPPALRNRSLTEALEELARRIRQHSGVEIHTQWSGTEGLTLHTNQSLMIYRALQEILTNALRHAGANEIHLEMVNHGDALSILVIDDGKGFDPAAAANGLGLQNIRARIGFIGGEVTVDSQPGQGATFMLDIPLTDKNI